MADPLQEHPLSAAEKEAIRTFLQTREELSFAERASINDYLETRTEITNAEKSSINNFLKNRTKLTFAERDAIWRYLKAIVLPSGIAFTLLSAIVGYVAGGINRLETSENAARFIQENGARAQKYITDAQEVAAAARVNAEAAQAGMKELQTKAQQAAASADETKDYLLKAKVQLDKVLTNDYSALADKLYAQDSFRKALANVGQQEIHDIQ